MIINEQGFTSPENFSERHYFELDVLRVFAVFMVVVIHVSAPVLYEFENMPSSFWMWANFYDSLSRMSVPLFFLTSGYLILGKSETILEFYKKRLIKVLVPLVAWSIFYFLWLHSEYFNGQHNVIEVVYSMLNAIYTGPVVFHLWFLYTLTGVYLAVPILRVLVRSSKNAELAYFVLLWFFAGPVLSILVKIVGRPPGLDEIPLASSYVGYFVLGYTARRFDFFRQAHFFIAVTAVCIAVTFLGTYYLSLRSNQFNGFFYDYLSLNIVAVSFSSFILILNWAWAKKPNPFFQVLSSLSFGIYLIHIFILEVFRRGTLGFKLAGWLAPPFYMIPVTSLAVFVVSALVVAILRKIPLAKFIVP